MNCAVCTELFDLAERRPKMPNCGHVYCQHCVHKILHVSSSVYEGVFKCPSTNREDSSSLVEMPEPPEIIKRLESNLLVCFEHQRMAFEFSSDTFEPRCRSCSRKGNVPQPNIPSTISSHFLSYYLKHKSQFSKQFRLYIKWQMRSRLAKRLETCYMMMLYCSNEASCRVHPNMPACCISLQTFRPECETCESNNNSVNASENLGELARTTAKFEQFRLKEYADYYGAVKRSLTSEQPWKKYVEIRAIQLFVHLYSLKTQKNHPGYELLICPGCGRFYDLGLRAPYTLSCGHALCFDCYKQWNSCLVCGNASVSATLNPLQDLYQYPTCEVCRGANKISLRNLPFHSVCDCIICGVCLQHNRRCPVHFEEFSLANESDLAARVHKRGLNRLFYLNTEVACFKCWQRYSTVFYVQEMAPICDQCNSQGYFCIRLTDYHEIDRLFFDRAKHFEPLDHPLYKTFSGLPLALKMKLYYDGCVIKQYREVKPWPCLLIHELRRFKVVYPVSKKDLRVFPTATVGELRVDFNASCSVRVVGVIMAGRCDFGRCKVNVRINGRDPISGNPMEYGQVSDEFYGKEGYVVDMNQIRNSSAYTIIARYLEPCEVFSGKFSDQETFTSAGVKFNLLPVNNNSVFPGPILGVLFTIDC
jgi:hypothetical protein